MRFLSPRSIVFEQISRRLDSVLWRAPDFSPGRSRLQKTPVPASVRKHLTADGRTVLRQLKLAARRGMMLPASVQKLTATHLASPPRRRGAFTLLEVLLVLIILGVIAALVVPRLTGTQQQAYRQAAEVAIKDLQAKIERYALQHDGTYPQSLEDLLKPVDKNGKPMAPYIEELPKDPWGQVFNYQVETDSTTGQVIVKIWSNGPNRQNENGAGDDVTSWNKEQ